MKAEILEKHGDIKNNGGEYDAGKEKLEG